MKRSCSRKMIVSVDGLLWALGLIGGIPPQAEAAQPIKIVTAHSSQKSFGDLAELLAWEAIKSKGYDVEFKAMATPELAAQALVNREAHAVRRVPRHASRPREAAAARAERACFQTPKPGFILLIQMITICCDASEGSVVGPWRPGIGSGNP